MEQYKARLVAQGYTQVSAIDFDETFIHVIKPTTIRILLYIAVVNNWLLFQIDIKKAFLNGFLKETVFMEQPPSFVDLTFPIMFAFSNELFMV